jgi:hypothetical protein
VPNVLNDISDKIPENTRKIFSLLSGEALWLREKWVNYNYLYGHSQERIDVLNKAGSTFFYILDHLFIDDLILSLSRLTDRAEGKDSNLSLELVKLDSNSQFDLVQKLKPLFEGLRQNTANIRKHRHKRIAHNDFDTTVQHGELLPSVSREMIEEVIIQIENYLNTFNHYFTNYRLMHEALTLHRGADILFSKLIKAKVYDLLEKEGVISRGYWRTDKMLSRLL